MQDDLLNAHFTTKGVRSLGSLNNCVVHVQMSIKYFRKKILTFISFGVSPVFSNMIFFRDLSDSIDVRVSLSVSK